MNPYSYFHVNTLERRKRCDLPLVQKSDLPVRSDYIEQIARRVDSITVVSRWFNMLCIHTSGDIAQLSSLPFVKRIERPQQLDAHLSIIDSSFATYSEALKFFQTERMEASVFAKEQINGRGVIVAIIDAGFTGMKANQAYEHMDVLKTWDFVRNDDNAYRGSGHGAAVAACLGGVDVEDNTFLGMAPEAKYLLARSERILSEATADEEYWLAAAEWADKHGADVINSSLGYTRRRYQVSDMDGRTALVSRAAKMAFRKGIVVVVSAGNEGDNSWKYISAPADVDSVVAVGGVDPYTDAHIGFSSFGPNAEYKLKPNVCAYGSVIVPDRFNGLVISKGTSFASPLVAGFVACMLQAFPEYDQHQLFQKLQESGHLYPYFDFAHGYGIPLAGKVLENEKTYMPVPFVIEYKNEALYISLLDTNRRDEPDEVRLKKLNVYVHVKNKEGKLIFYGCYRDVFPEGRLLSMADYDTGSEVMVHFEGTTQTYIVQQ